MARGLERQTEIYLGGVSGVTPQVPLDAARLERRAGQALAPEAFAYIAAGAGNGRCAPTARRSSAGGSCRACCATSPSATPASSSSVAGCTAPSCSRRSGSWSSPTARPTWPWPARPAPSACR